MELRGDCDVRSWSEVPRQARDDADRDAGRNRDNAAAALSRRLRRLAEGRSYRELGEPLGFSTETTRRYVQSPAARLVWFLQRLAEEHALSGDWLLLGAGPMHRHEAADEAVRSASDERIAVEYMRRLARLAKEASQAKTPPEIIVRAAAQRALDEARRTADSNPRAKQRPNEG